MKPKAFVALVGAILIVVGIVVGFAWDTSIVAAHTNLLAGERLTSTVSCGSTFVPADLSATPFGTNAITVQDICNTTSGHGLIVWLLIGIGLVVLAVALLVTRKPVSVSVHAEDADAARSNQ